MWMGENRQVMIVTSPAADSPSCRKIGVFLLDDHEIVRRGVRELLEAEPDIRVVGEAGTVSSALARIPALLAKLGMERRTQAAAFAVRAFGEQHDGASDEWASDGYGVHPAR